MGLASTRVGGLYVFSCLLVGGYHNGFSYKKKLKLKPVPWTDLVLIDCNISGSLAGKCKYDCQQSGLCFVRYVGPQRPGKTTVSTSHKFINNSSSFSVSGVKTVPQLFDTLSLNKPNTRAPACQTCWVVLAVGHLQSASTATKSSGVKGSQTSTKVEQLSSFLSKSATTTSMSITIRVSITNVR